VRAISGEARPRRITGRQGGGEDAKTQTNIAPIEIAIAIEIGIENGIGIGIGIDAP